MPVLTEQSCRRTLSSDNLTLQYWSKKGLSLPRDDIDQMMRNITITTASRNLRRVKTNECKVMNNYQPSNQSIVFQFSGLCNEPFMIIPS